MTNIYGKAWDDYVRQQFPNSAARRNRKLAYPGDEWGTDRFWNATFEQLFLKHGAAAWRRAVEIGPGAGKYTERALAAAPELELMGFDVSQAFIDVCAARLAPYGKRLELRLLDGRVPHEMLDALDERGWSGTIDAFFAIDVLVHIDLQVTIAYLLTAAASLRQGGLLIATFADPTSTEGFDKLLADIKPFFGKVGEPSAKFEYVDRSIVETILQRIGFHIRYCGNWLPKRDGEGRDLYVVAELQDVARARFLAHHLR